MRLTAILMVVAVLHVSARTNGQKVSLRTDHLPLEAALAKLKLQTGLLFIYNDREIAHAKPVTVDVKDASISAVLNLLFEDQPLNYELQENTVFIVNRPPAPVLSLDGLATLPVYIKGVVTDSAGSPLIGASIQINHAKKFIITDEKGEFSLTAQTGDELTVSYVGFQTINMRVFANMTWLNLSMHPLQNGLKEIVVNTGYQTLSAERATGSFVQVNNELYNRRVGIDVLSKLDGIVSGMYFTNSTSAFSDLGQYVSSANVNQFVTTTKLGITIRGQSTLSNQVSRDPLIIVDNFPYEGDINNLNPETIESVTVLKDAAAASIWGARAGNGVIVLTTKKGKAHQATQIDFNENFTVAGKPDIYKDNSFVDANDYINVEDTLFTKGYYDAVLSSTRYPAVSPVVAILAKQRAGQLSAADAKTQIDAYRNQDVRKDISKYFYRNSLNQQYSLSLRGGGNNFTYATTLGYDNVKTNRLRNQFNKIVLNSSLTYTPVKDLDITGGLTYTHTRIQDDNLYGWGASALQIKANSSYGILPYTQLADAQGNHLAVTQSLSTAYLDSTRKLGFQDWNLRPLDELALADNGYKQTSLVLDAGVKYKFAHFFHINLLYHNETQNGLTRNYYSPQTFYVRNLINTYTQYNPATHSLTYPLPVGGILNLKSYDLTNNNYRALLNYDENIAGKHKISALAGAEIRELVTTTYGVTEYGYDDQYGTVITNLDYKTSFPENPSSAAAIPAPNGEIDIYTNRYVSYYSNLGYTYDDRYSFTLSGRKDGANIFGVKTNDKVTPLWSTGVSWNISSEKFYRVDWMPYLRFKASYGYNGNVYNASAYLTAYYSTSSLSGLQYASITTPPNPDLRWERVKNINIGFDFDSKNHRIGGTVEVYQKEGLDLLEPTPLEPSIGIGSLISGGNGLFVTKNAASTRTNGIDLTLNTRILDGKFKWYNSFILSTVNTKTLKYDVPLTTYSFQGYGFTMKGRPITALYSYRWAGLDPTNGDPQGYLGGKVSKDYNGIINNYNPDSLSYNGSTVPTIYGFFRNTFSYSRFSLSFNVKYKLGYVFRRTPLSGNLSDIVYLAQSKDYMRRWQQPGDEKKTDIPSEVYPSNSLRKSFYQYSTATVEKGGLIRLQDISLSYDLKDGLIGKGLFRKISVFMFVDNVGMIWKANKAGMDPDYGYIPPIRSYSFGVKTNL